MPDAVLSRPVAIVPAAGSSRRFGRPKLMAPFGGRTIVGATLDALRDGGAEPLLVRAAGNNELASWAAAHGVRSVENPAPERGMLSSILEGIRALPVPPSAWPLLVCPADLPALRASSVAAVLAHHQRREAALTVPAWCERRGHPLAISPALIPEIHALDPTVGLRQLLDRHAERLLLVPVDDPGVVRDVDTPADYAALTLETIP